MFPRPAGPSIWMFPVCNCAQVHSAACTIAAGTAVAVFGCSLAPTAVPRFECSLNGGPDLDVPSALEVPSRPQRRGILETRQLCTRAKSTSRSEHTWEANHSQNKKQVAIALLVHEPLLHLQKRAFKKGPARRRRLAVVTRAEAVPLNPAYVIFLNPQN